VDEKAQVGVPSFFSDNALRAKSSFQGEPFKIIIFLGSELAILVANASFTFL
jgi:hypothetical protein